MKKIIITIICVLISLTSVYASENQGLYNTLFASSSDFADCYVIKTDGDLYKIPCFKFDDDFAEYEVPTEDMIPLKVMDDVISVSGDTVLKDNGTVLEWDEEKGGFFAIADNVKKISSHSATLFIKNDNSLWGIGSNIYGQLARGTMDKSLELQMKENAKWRNKTKCFPEYYAKPVKIMDDVKSALTDWTVSVVLKNDGTVWTFGGDQGGGALGIGGRWIVNNKPTQILSGIREIFRKQDACFALDENNTLWRWGTNCGGYIDLSDDRVNIIPKRYIENVKYATNMCGYNLIIRTDNSLWIYGDTDKDNGDIGYTTSEAPIKLSDNVASVVGLAQQAFDDDRVFVLKENGDLVLYKVPLYENKEPYEAGKIMHNVRMPYDMENTKQFADISSKSDEMQKAIKAMSRAKIINGISEAEFAPDKTLSRAETAALLLRMAAIAEESGNGGFADVTNDDWYYSVAGLSKKYGIVNGFEDNTFRGNESVSKIQLVSLAARTLASERKYDITVNKSLSVPEWAREDISLAVTTGLVDEKEKFDGDITRGEAAVILYRLYELI